MTKEDFKQMLLEALKDDLSVYVRVNCTGAHVDVEVELEFCDETIDLDSGHDYHVFEKDAHMTSNQNLWVDGVEHPRLQLAKLLEQENPYAWVYSESSKELRKMHEENEKLQQDAFRYRALRAYKKSDFGFDSAESMDSLADQMVELGNPDAKQSD